MKIKLIVLGIIIALILIIILSVCRGFKCWWNPLWWLLLLFIISLARTSLVFYHSSFMNWIFFCSLYLFQLFWGWEWNLYLYGILRVYRLYVWILSTWASFLRCLSFYQVVFISFINVVFFFLHTLALNQKIQTNHQSNYYNCFIAALDCLLQSNLIYRPTTHRALPN